MNSQFITHRFAVTLRTFSIFAFVSSNIAFSQVTKSEYYEVMQQIHEIYYPIAKLHGRSFVVRDEWSSNSKGAGSYHEGDDYFKIYVSGGLARYRGMTKDALSKVMCHEAGHIFGGFPFSSVDVVGWLSAEPNPDYYAGQVCLRSLWKHQTEENLRFISQGGKTVAQRCKAAWGNLAERALCHRIAVAALVDLSALAEIEGWPIPSYDVSTTENDINCRLQTNLAGATCTVEFDMSIIPGFHFSFEERNSLAAEKIALDQSCYVEEIGARPSCWFNQRIGQ